MRTKGLTASFDIYQPDDDHQQRGRLWVLALAFTHTYRDLQVR
jgi:hypothetical protein